MFAFRFALIKEGKVMTTLQKILKADIDGVD